MEIDLGKLEIDPTRIRGKSGKLVRASLFDIQYQLDFVYGELSLYRQQNNLDPDEFEHIEASLLKALKELEMI